MRGGLLAALMLPRQIPETDVSLSPEMNWSDKNGPVASICRLMTSRVARPEGSILQGRERYDRAFARAQDLRSFYASMELYVVVNAILFIVDITTAGGAWVYWPLLGWGRMGNLSLRHRQPTR